MQATLKLPPDEYQKGTGNPILWPSQYLSQKTQDLDSSTEEFGALPTGDSLIDIGSSPGPKESEIHEMGTDRQRAHAISHCCAGHHLSFTRQSTKKVQA